VTCSMSEYHEEKHTKFESKPLNVRDHMRHIRRWIKLALCAVQLRAPVNTTVNVRFLEKPRNFSPAER
jgi:hypothetical protein